MTTNVFLSPTPILQFFNNAGQPNAGGSILTQVGGVNYPTYQDSAGNTPLPNPIPLNSRGEISNTSGISCQLFLATGIVYTFTQYDANGNQINQASYVGTNALSSSLFSNGNLAYVVPSISALRALSHASYTIAFVDGYYSSGDGGGGFYWYNASDTTSADNGGTIIEAADGGRWYLIHTGSVTAKQFGAYGNGTNDDTNALTNWIASGLSLFGPDGNFKTSGQLTMNNNGQSLICSGQFVIVKSGSTGYDGLVVTGNNCTIENLQVNGNSVGMSSRAGSGIGVKGQGNLLFGCQAYSNGAHGIYLDGQSTTCIYNRIESCQAYSNGQVGFPSNTAPDNIRIGNVAYNNAYEGITNDAPSYRAVIADNKVIGNCTAGGVGGIGVDQASGAAITGNVVGSTQLTRPGLQFQNNLATTSFCTVTGNEFHDNTGGGIHLYANTGATGGPFYASFNVIADNTFQNNTNFDIQIDTGCIGNVLSGIPTTAVVKDFNRGGINPKSGYGCSFRAYANTARNNVTGNGATYQIPYDGVTVNNSNSYNTNGTFTAPISGVYKLIAACRLQGGSTETFAQIKILQTGSIAQTSQGEVDVPTMPAGEATGTFNLFVSDLFFMQTGDAAVVQIFASGASSNDLSIPSSQVNSYFSGVLVG